MIKSSNDFINQRATAMAAGIGGPSNYMTAEGVPIHLSGLQARATLDPNFQRTDPMASALYKYREGLPENGPAYGAGNALHNWALRPRQYGASGNGIFGTNGPISGALAAGLPALLLGLGAGWLADKVSGRQSYWTPRLATAAGVAGAGLGAYTGYQRNKTASVGWKSDDMYDPADQVAQIISAAPDITFQQKRVFLQNLASLSDSEVSSLLRMLMASGGFGIGAILARFLLGAGTVGTLAGGLIGGLLGNAMASTSKKDAFGRNTLGGNDIFGNPFVR